MASEVGDIALKMVWFGIGTGVAAFLETTLFSLSSKMQAATIRRLYYHAILSQEMGWHDSQETGALASRISGYVFDVFPN